ncbi:MAG TPA: [protein-PII] uridylyltransferase [Actinomycetota bacterium]
MSGIPALIQRVQDERRAFRARLDEGLGGLDHARETSAAMDAVLADLWAEASGGDAERGVALVALGGYGRGELSPQSDVDLMILHDGKHDVERSKQVFYALWDAGLKVGHATRSLKDCLRLARENLEAETSFLITRRIAGDAALHERFADEALRATRKRGRRFVEDVRAMVRARHAASGSATSQLEPNLKEGAGGLRDLHALAWFEVVDERAQALIDPAVRAALDEAGELLLRVRARLHYLEDRPTDVLRFEHQRPIALAMGYVDGERPAEDVFMRAVFSAARAVEHSTAAMLADLMSGDDKVRTGGEPFAVAAGRVVVATEPDLRAEPERALQLFAMGAPPGAQALSWLARALEGVEALPWTDAVRDAFFGLLRAGHPHVLETLDHAGVLARLLPEWDAVRCQPQRNVYHRYTVDAHLFTTVVNAGALGASTEDPLLRDVADDVGDRDLLLLAALLHDVGKGTEEDHSARGARIARSVAQRMRLDPVRTATLVWLVENHLVLVDAATRRDLGDENLVVEVAERIGDAARARLLFLLSVADGRATGPTAWSAWKAALVAELFTKVLAVLERGSLVSRDATELARLRVSEVRRGLARYPAEDVERHLAGMPRAYVLAFPAQAMIRHFALTAGLLTAEGAVRTHRAPTEDPGITELTIVVPDRPGIVARAAGVLALNGVSVVDAQMFTRHDGVALQIFRCTGAFEPLVEAERWDRVERDLERAFLGRLSIDARLAERRETYETGVRKAPAVAPKVVIDNAASDFLTVVEVHAPDRVGLLYDIASALTEMGLDIQTAKIATYGEDVVDVFYLRDLEGQKVTDREHLAEIERAVLHRLGR